MLLTARLYTALVASCLSANLFAAGKASHVVVIVWDGMRPDFASDATTPNLMRLARGGVTFNKHHAAYISTTEVNGTALATGVYPAESGIVGNKEFRPAINAAKKVLTEALQVVRKGDELTGGHYLGFPTVAETLQNHRLRTVIAGAKGVALLHDRAPRPMNSPGITLFAGEVLPEQQAEQIIRALGEFPEEGLTGIERDLWTTRALIGPLWEKGVPPFSLLWLSEPDYSQHQTGPGSPTSIAAIRHSDDALGRVLAALEQKGLVAETDFIVVSDHGFSTIDQNAEVAETLNANGFHAYRTLPEGEARKADIMVVGNGGSVFLYVIGHQPSDAERVVHFLQSQSFCGVIFTQQPVEGAFRLHDVRMDSPYAPDIVLSLRWRSDKSTNGTVSLIYSDYGKYGPGQGMHGSLSPFDMHNICFATGPDFRKGLQDDLPTGNLDIAPTILWLLGIKPERQPSGRVLTEALTQAEDARPQSEVHELEATWRGEGFAWHQYLKYSQVRGVLYFDEGNGGQASSKAVGGN
jgi:predicted AlkP superfamily pyrophosphatase or phosphodiesterase